jgi:LAS superfamily LD-carboxypeptidase LdcB
MNGRTGRRDVQVGRGSLGRSRIACVLLLVVAGDLSACVSDRARTQAPVVQERGSADASTNDGSAAAVAPPAPVPTVDASSQAPAPEAAASYGPARNHGLVACTIRKNPYFIATEDQQFSYVDKNDWLALVNRSPMGTLAPDDLPVDLVDVRTLEAASSNACESKPCLRKEAAVAMKELLADMNARGFPGVVESPYRSYINQCLTFRRWAEDGFCAATEQSALPGHSQHQLGTTADLFTAKWKKDGNGNVFRGGFGCTDAGTYLREQAYLFGFVLPYPLHVDDARQDKPCEARADRPARFNPLTGYKNEAWHLRYIGKDYAAQFHDASVKNKALTLEGWIRAQKGLTRDGDVALPACDGCNCGACASFTEKSACKGRALRLDASGFAIRTDAIPELLSISAVRTARMWTLTARVRVPVGVVTSTPVPDERPLAPTTPSILDAHALQITYGDVQWRVGLTQEVAARVYNGASVLLPAQSGEQTLTLRIETDAMTLHASIEHAGKPIGEPVPVRPIVVP